MGRVVLSLLLLSIVASVRNEEASDTEITRVKPLTQEEKNRPAPEEKTRSIYLVNLVPVPPDRYGQVSGGAHGSNDLNQPPSNRGNPTLFLLQPVKQDNGPLPNGIYYRPPKDQKEMPTSFVKNLTDLQSFILARGPHQHPGKQ